MSIYDKSSLVLIPSGTKAGKVYSQKPVSGDGDFTFTRSSAATRVNASGNIEKETGNLLLQSNSFDTTWTLSTASISVSGGQNGYDGSNDAWLLERSDASSRYITQAVTSSGVNTFSVYAKPDSVGWMYVYVAGGGVSRTAYFDITNGALGSTSNVITTSIEAAGNGYYRCSIVVDATITTIRLYPAVANGSVTGGVSPAGIYIQDAQLEQGLVARDYIETTTSAVYGGITDNVPRLDYTDSSCPALLLEPQRTNLITQSEYFNSSYWIKGGLPVFSVSDNAGISPEGVSNATRFVAASAQQSTRLYTSVTWTAVPYTISLYVKNNGGTNTNLRFSYYDGSGQYFSPTFTLTDEWQRIEYTFTPTASSGGFWLVNTPTAGLNLDLLVFAAQLEEGSYATSYIPTYGSSVTRVLDSCGTRSDMQDFLGINEGTWFTYLKDMYFDITGTSVGTFTLRETSGLQIEIMQDGNFMYRVDINNSTAVQDLDGEDKLAVAWSTSGLVIYVNGSSVYSTTDPQYASAYSTLYLPESTRPARVELKQMLFFPTRLTNAELEDLTTL